ncbi:hypothetical protein O9X98_04385 [Agrobacterium salinitolerans]|nr:hypothetical protein [Agrobacterium salinitolerans]
MRSMKKAFFAAVIAAIPTAAMAEAVLVGGIYVSSGLPKRTIDGTEEGPLWQPSAVAAQEEEKLSSEVLELDFVNYCTFNGHDRSNRTSETLPCRKGGNYRAVLRDGKYVEFFRLDGNSSVPLVASTSFEKNIKKVMDFDDIRRSFGLPPL